MKRNWLLVFLLLVACTQSSGAQTSIVEESSCELPCWNNIIVGKTSEQEVLQVISTLPIVENKSILVTNQPRNIFDNQIFFQLNLDTTKRNNAPNLSQIDLSDNLVRVLALCGNLNTTIGEIVERTGKPEGIISGGSVAGGRDVILINSKIGISFWYNTDETPKKSEFIIDPEIQVHCLVLFDPFFYEEMLEAGLFSMGHYNAEETLRVLYPWDGYGNLDEKYPPRQP
jgi:hypothetical protein